MNGNGNELNSKYARVYGKKKKSIPWLAISAVALFIAAVILLAVLLRSCTGTVRLTSLMGGTVFEDKRHGITYVLAPMCYEPIAYGDVYAECGEMKFFSVCGDSSIKDIADIYASPKEYLCTSEYGIYDLYCSDTVTLPTLEEFEAFYARCFAVESIASQSGYIGETETEELVRYFLSADVCDTPTDIETSLEIKFMSRKYLFLYYSVNFYKTADGKRYIYDRSAGRCVDLGDNFADVLKG